LIYVNATRSWRPSAGLTVKELRDQYGQNIRFTGLAMLGAPMTVMRWRDRLCSRDLDLAWS